MLGELLQEKVAEKIDRSQAYKGRCAVPHGVK